MSRESIAFLKKMARQAASEAKREMPQKRSFRSAVNRACSSQKRKWWLYGCNGKRSYVSNSLQILEAVSVLKTEIRAGRSLTRKQRKMIQKTWLWKYSLLKQFTKRNSIFLWRANWPTYPCQTARMGSKTPKGLITAKVAEVKPIRGSVAGEGKRYYFVRRFFNPLSG